MNPLALDELPGTSNYFTGNQRSKWREGVKSYARVLYRSVRPGLDVAFYGHDGRSALEYDLILAPGSDPSDVVLAFEGSDAMEIGADGDLVLHAKSGDIRQRPPTAYQARADGKRTYVTARYREQTDGTVAFVLGPYDHTQELVIDPTLLYSTYLGGAGDEFTRGGIALDSTGSVYVVGMTNSTNFPADSTHSFSSRNYDTFVTKLSAGGSIVYSTFLGGSGDDFPGGVAVDGIDNVYIAGTTDSLDFPTLQAFQNSNHGGDADGFVVKLSSTGGVVYSTYLGGTGSDGGSGIAVEANGSASVSGSTDSTDFPTTPFAIQTSNHGGDDVFVTKLTADGAMVFSTYIGGAGREQEYAIAVNRFGSVYCSGGTSSSDFPTKNPVRALNQGGNDAFVTKLDSGGSLVYSTYLGGSNDDVAGAIAVDAQGGSAYIAGATTSSDFPIEIGSAVQPALAGMNDVFVTKLDPNGNLIYSTYLGGTMDDRASDIAVDALGSAFVVGNTNSSDFPVKGAFQSRSGGGIDGFVARLSADGATLVYSTYIGGSASDEISGIALDSSDVAYVSGDTSSTNFPTTASAYQLTNGGALDAIIAKISPLDPPPSVPAGTPLTSAAIALLLVTSSLCFLTLRSTRRDPH